MSVTAACREISELTPTAQKACNLFLERCRAEGLNVLVTETYRSQERQDYLYAQGRTRAGNKVTWTKKSRHTSRRAWDICKNVKGAEYSDTAFFKRCGQVADGLGITWGGNWSSPDMPHFEISENWTYKGEEEMTTAEKQEFEALKSRVQALNDEIWRINNPDNFSEEKGNIPEWAKEAVDFFASEKIIQGDGTGLKLSALKLWFLTVLYRTIKK